MKVAPDRPGAFDQRERARLEQAIAAHKRQIDGEFEARVAAEVEQRVQAEVERIRAEVGIQFATMEKRAKEAQAQVNALKGRIPHSLFRLLLGAVHADRYQKAEPETQAAMAECFAYLKAHQAALAMTPGEEAEGVARVKRDQEMIERVRRHRAAEAERKAERERKAAERREAKRRAADLASAPPELSA